MGMCDALDGMRQRGIALPNVTRRDKAVAHTYVRRQISILGFDGLRFQRQIRRGVPSALIGIVQPTGPQITSIRGLAQGGDADRASRVL
jgi:hypothetical protein